MALFDVQSLRYSSFRTGMYGYDSHTRYYRGMKGDPGPRVRKGPQDYFAAAALFGIGGTGMKRETILNSIGFLTRHQKQMIQNAPGVIESFKKEGLKGFFSAGFNKAANAGLIFGVKYAVPGIIAYDALANDANALDIIGSYTLPELGFFTGWHVGKNIGMGVGASMAYTAYGTGMVDRSKGVPKKPISRLGFLGGVGGAITGAAAGLAAGVVVSELSDSLSTVNKMAYEFKHSDFRSEVMETQNTLTNRQRMLAKLSKSGLNDRANLLGNEALVVAGLL